MTEKLRLDLKRTPKPEKVEEVEEQGAKVSAGAVEKIVDLVFNPTREKIREVTIIDRLQGRLFPVIDQVNSDRAYILEIAAYRENKTEFFKTYSREKPLPPNSLDDLLYRTAQWQKSVGGINLNRATEIALTEVEAKAMEDEGGLKGIGKWDPEDS